MPDQPDHLFVAFQRAVIARYSLERELGRGGLVADLTERRHMRLDLLRLRTGGGSVEGITSDIAAARAFGEEADRLLASGRDVEDAIRATT